MEKFEALKEKYYINQINSQGENAIFTVSEAQMKALYPERHVESHNLRRNYQLSTCHSDSSSSIFHMSCFCIVPIHMEIPLFNQFGERISQFKMMAKIIGKNGVFLKQIKTNCASAFPAKINGSNQESSSSSQNQNLRIELTKVYSENQMRQIR